MIKLKEKKTLLIATDSFLPRWDGISRVLEEIIPYLEKNYQIIILAPDFKGKKYQFPGVKVVRFPLMGFEAADYTPPKPTVRQIKSLVKHSDLVWGQTVGPIGALSMYYAKKYKKPLLAYIHSVEWELFSESLQKFKRTIKFAVRLAVKNLYNKCDLLILPSETTKEEIEAKGIKAKKEVIHLGVDITRFSPSRSKEESKAKLGLKKDNIVIGYLGRFGREKDLDTLYRAFKSLNAEFKNMTLLLVGGEKEKLNFESYENVKVVGPTDVPEKYYRAMDIYVLPSKTETTSLTTLEAMSTEVPVVCTSVGHIPNYIDHKRNGFLFPPGSAERLILILKLLMRDEKVRHRIGKRGRKTVMNNYSWKATAEELKEVIGRFG